MSAPHTNVEKQEKQHKAPLAGMGAVVAFAIILLGALAIWVFYAGNDPDDADVKIDGRDGDAVVVEEADPTEPAN